MKFKIFDLKYNKCLKEIGVQRFDAKSKNRSSAKLTMQNVATFSFDIFDAHVDIEILNECGSFEVFFYPQMLESRSARTSVVPSGLRVGQI